MNKIAYAALLIGLTASTAGFSAPAKKAAATSIQCNTSDQFCQDINTMLSDMDTIVQTDLPNMATSSQQITTDANTAKP